MELLEDVPARKKKYTLPTTRANILHTLRDRKIVTYTLADNYDWLKVSATILYLLQSAQCVFNISFDKTKMLRIMDGKIIYTSNEWDENHADHKIKSVIANPLRLSNPDQKPSFFYHIKYEEKDYFFLSFRYDAFLGQEREKYILVSINAAGSLEAKKIGEIDFASSREVTVIQRDWIPTLVVKHAEPDAPGGIYEYWEYKYEETYNLKDQKRDAKSHFFSYGKPMYI